MKRHHKVQSAHRERLAYIYIRQSSLGQVKQHLESQDLQYQLVQRAQTLGWSEDQVVVIDDDLGKSAVSATDRHGFQELVAAVGLGRVGIILVTDVSRLARNCSDWYQLLDLASVYGTLISDASGIYDPRIYDDRLLLGLKGTFSEAQWYNMRTQLQAARLNKARRGELATRLPVGYDRLPNGQVVFTPDQQVQSSIRLVFEQFERLGSARAVLRYWRSQRLQLPYRIPSGPDHGVIEWRRPKYQTIYHILKNPAYAGAYAYGKHRTLRLPGAHEQVVNRTLPMEEWSVLIPDAFTGYITWEQYMRNQKQLCENAQGVAWTKGAPRAGIALLQGIVLCGRCGRRMRSRYRDKPAYVCEETNRQYGEPRCQHSTVSHVDQAVIQVFLEAIQPLHLEAALAAVEQVEVQRQRLAQQWQQRLERARYEEDLARRRYQRVDPDNRLVAAELERQWEEALQTCQRLEREWVQAQSEELAPLAEADRARIRQLAEDIPALWYAETTTQEERKRLLRCLVQDVTLDPFTKPGFSLIAIRWHTGTTTTVEVNRPKPGGPPAPPALIQRVRELAQHHPDDQVAAILKAEGVPTARGAVWTTQRVRNFRNKHKIPSACPYVTSKPGPRGDGLIKAAEAAERVGVTPSMIADWFRRGLLAGHQRRPGTPLWVRLSNEDLRRLDGSASLAPDLLPVKEAPTPLEMTADQMQKEIRAGRLLTYRLLIHNRWRWYIQIPDRFATRKFDT
ncbi:MAG: recombinase family protein [Anaerolineae bacterium]|jgi:DNA invertase Pin-like site-specific DNA recombinase